jgi:hypothetical protein
MHTRAEIQSFEWIRAQATKVTLGMCISETERDCTTKEDAEARFLAYVT